MNPPKASSNPDHHRARWSPSYEDRICYECSQFVDWGGRRADVVVLWPCAVAHEAMAQARHRRHTARSRARIVAACV